MSQKNKLRSENNLLPFPVIKAASEGNVQALQTVLKHYEGYITALSTRCMYDEFGQALFCVDETLRKRLEAKLIAKTLAFRPTPRKKSDSGKA